MSRFKPYILLLPAALVIFGILASGVVTALLQSVGYFPIIGLRDFTLNYYKEVIFDRSFLESFSFSLYTSLFSSCIAVVLGVLLSYSLIEHKERKAFEKIVYKLPLVVPHTVAALFLFNILSQSGVLPRILYYFGILKDQNYFANLIFDRFGIGIIITYLWKEIPFIAMVTYSVMSNIDEGLKGAAMNLGASRRQYFWHVLIPLLWPSIISSFIIIFAFSFGAFEVPYLLGPTSPKALPVKAYIEFLNPDLSNRPYAMTMDVILTFISLLLVWLYDKIFGLIYKKA